MRVARAGPMVRVSLRRSLEISAMALLHLVSLEVANKCRVGGPSLGNDINTWG